MGEPKCFALLTGAIGFQQRLTLARYGNGTPGIATIPAIFSNS